MAEIMGGDALLQVKIGEAFVSATIARDVTLVRGVQEADVTTRGSGAYEDAAVARLSLGVNFELLYDPEDTVYGALETAYYGRSKVEIKLLDKAEGSEHVQMFAVVTNFEQAEPLNGAQMVSVSLKKARGAITVGGGEGEGEG